MRQKGNERNAKIRQWQPIALNTITRQCNVYAGVRPGVYKMREFDCPEHDVDIRVNVRPSETELSDLCESVGWLNLA